jgi:transposase
MIEVPDIYTEQLQSLDDGEWHVLQMLIPNACSSNEMQNRAIRCSVNAILWRMRTGKPWRFIPREYGEPTSIFRRFTRWRDAGVWRNVTMSLARMRESQRHSVATGMLEARARERAQRLSGEFLA